MAATTPLYSFKTGAVKCFGRCRGHLLFQNGRFEKFPQGSSERPTHTPFFPSVSFSGGPSLLFHLSGCAGPSLGWSQGSPRSSREQRKYAQMASVQLAAKVKLEWRGVRERPTTHPAHGKMSATGSKKKHGSSLDLRAPHRSTTLHPTPPHHSEALGLRPLHLCLS